MTSKFDFARFYDNDSNHIRNIISKTSIECVKICCSDGRRHQISDSYMNIHYRENNLFFLRYILPNIRENNYTNQDELSGISDFDIIDIERWIESKRTIKPSCNIAVIFDFDRTISKTEGFELRFPTMELCDRNIKDVMKFFIPRLEDVEYNKISIDFLTYICGGGKRFAMIQYMFKMLASKNVSIYINTSNTACLSNFFRDIIANIIGKDERGEKILYTILCSGVDKTEQLKGDFDNFFITG
jgi:hypothetical protein